MTAVPCGEAGLEAWWEITPSHHDDSSPFDPLPGPAHPPQACLTRGVDAYSTYVGVVPCATDQPSGAPVDTELLNRQRWKLSS